MSTDPARHPQTTLAEPLEDVAETSPATLEVAPPLLGADTLECDEVLLYHDQPLLWVDLDAAGQHWLAMVLDAEDDDVQRVLYTWLSHAARRELYAGTLTLRDAVCVHSGGIGWTAVERGHGPAELHALDITTLDDDDLPQPGVYLTDPEPT